MVSSSYPYLDSNTTEWSTVKLSPAMRAIKQSIESSFDDSVLSGNILQWFQKTGELGVLWLNRPLTRDSDDVVRQRHHIEFWDDFLKCHFFPHLFSTLSDGKSRGIVIAFLGERLTGLKDSILELYEPVADKIPLRILVTPDPEEQYNRFVQEKPFKKINHYLVETLNEPINWVDPTCKISDFLKTTTTKTTKTTT
eukprot:TRINITY_DN4701_c0_g1_i1.p1 TRINITY_DN4701_c0_g1~~TRINITY_DN4701_c0_g1_i1.p1  ORF type:complete len:196 (-),score=20.17 TRINITY_DN4701_c0_g1_i1:13-600(-)